MYNPLSKLSILPMKRDCALAAFVSKTNEATEGPDCDASPAR